jgi:spoIIIJ-associated protein
MSDFKEFQGKNLDEAIESACDYFNLKRDRLEIEILGGGSTGIFGIMGVKKAKVKARPRVQVNATDILNGNATSETKEAAPKAEPRKPKAKPESKPEPKAEPKAKQAPKPAAEAAPQAALESHPLAALESDEDEVNGNVDETARPARKPRERKPRGEKPKNADRPRRERAPRERKPRETVDTEEHPRANMADFDPVILEKTVHEVMVQMLTPIIGETKIEITLESDRVKVFIDDEENSGLIIGREGQTLSSLQYLVNRLVSRKMEASVRIQVDTGDYRERQDDKLRQVAWHLAEKAGTMGRTQSTKPLSSYHRRVVHLALQDNEEVFTRSKGDGPMKRVLIVPKNRKNGNRSSRY